VYVIPSNPFSAVGENYEVRCRLVTVTGNALRDVSWLLNGSSLEILGLDGVLPHFSTIGSGIGFLTFSNLAMEHNFTTIKCIGHLNSGDSHTSEGVVLLLQGIIIVSDQK
jgi:hypothetical protein